MSVLKKEALFRPWSALQRTHACKPVMFMAPPCHRCLPLLSSRSICAPLSPCVCPSLVLCLKIMKPRYNIPRPRWKRKFEDTRADLLSAKRHIEDRDAAIVALAARLTPIEVDLAILAADRGRPAPKYAPPPPVYAIAAGQPYRPQPGDTTAPGQAGANGSNTAVSGAGRGGSRLGTSDRPRTAASEGENIGAPETVGATGQQREGEAQTFTITPVTTAHDTSADSTTQPSEQSESQQQQPQVPVGPLEGLEGAQALGISSAEFGDMARVYDQWDALNKQALAMQLRLDQEGKNVDAARRAYERARAIYYTNPTDPTLAVRWGSGDVVRCVVVDD